MVGWIYVYDCDKCGRENNIILGQSNPPTYHFCHCGKMKFNDKEFMIDNDGAIERILK